MTFVEGWRDVRFPCDRAARRVRVTDRWPIVAAREIYPAEIRVHADGRVSGRGRELLDLAVAVELNGDTAIAQLRSTT
ncbi:hypothetical protein DMP23_10080 [Amycolatopsis sp. A1MSW2902]|uniref:hypothetical protein n=1 Tax=Amycolatopsis sp. A1MSW2902 TaxID=687413 RepID=UPI00307E780E